MPTSSRYANDIGIGPISTQQHRSQQSLSQLQQSLQQLQQQQQMRLQQLQSSHDSSLLPEDNTECLRFYKNLASRERRQTALISTMVVSSDSSSTDSDDKRARRKRSVRRLQRPRPRLLGGHRRDNSPTLAIFDEANDEAVAEHNRFGQPDSTVKFVKTSTLDTNSENSETLNELPAIKSSKIDISEPNKIRYIFHKGRMQPVEVMKWPRQARIAPSERYKLEEPMKSRYGRRSLFTRLFKAFEKSKHYAESIDPSDIRGPIPFLPRRLAESTRTRLLLWYKPMESSGEFNGTAD